MKFSNVLFLSGVIAYVGAMMCIGLNLANASIGLLMYFIVAFIGALFLQASEYRLERLQRRLEGLRFDLRTNQLDSINLKLQRLVERKQRIRLYK